MEREAVCVCGYGGSVGLHADVFIAESLGWILLWVRILKFLGVGAVRI